MQLCCFIFQTREYFEFHRRCVEILVLVRKVTGSREVLRLCRKPGEWSRQFSLQIEYLRKCRKKSQIYSRGVKCTSVREFLCRPLVVSRELLDVISNFTIDSAAEIILKDKLYMTQVLGSFSKIFSFF